MVNLSKCEALEDAEMAAADGGLLMDPRIVIVGCTPPFPPIKPGQIPWNLWIGQPYPGGWL